MRKFSSSTHALTTAKIGLEIGGTLTVLISLEQVSRDFDNGQIVALRDVNLVVAKAKSVAMVAATAAAKPH